MGKVKAHELRKQSLDQLEGELTRLKTDLQKLRVAKVTGGATSQLSKIKSFRKDIARVLTVISQETRKNVALAHKGKKYQPLDIRKKYTRAIRRRLTPHQAAQETGRQRSKRLHFPQRVYAVKA